MSNRSEDGARQRQRQLARRFETLTIHGGWEPEPTTHAVAVPVYQTASYAFDDTQHGADLFDNKARGYIYTRIMNPTNHVLEKRVSMLEGGGGGLSFASGMAAITGCMVSLAEAGDNIVSSRRLYGGTYNLFAYTLRRQGIETRFFPPDDVDAAAAMIDERTRAVFIETIGNPGGEVPDLAALASCARTHGVPLVVDNTVASPALCRPIEHGADIVIHSATKYLGGHGTSIAGVIVDSLRFPWAQHAARFPRLCAPDPTYHGMTFTEVAGPAAFIAMARVVTLRDTGAALSPFNAFQILQGIETLGLRMERHCANALAVARFLEQHPKVAWVSYPGLPSHPSHAMVERYLGGRGSGVLTFGCKGGRSAGARFIDALELFVRLVNIGDARSLACHPASTTHRQMSDEELEQSGIGEELVRLSVGLEHIDDLLADLDQALGHA